jgi:hypothetical protein
MFSLFALSALAATIVSAQNDNTSPLDKPNLVDNLDYLSEGLIGSLSETDYTLDQWDYGLIPQDCKTAVTGGVYSDVSYSPADFEMYNVTYSDVSQSLNRPWLCIIF